MRNHFSPHPNHTHAPKNMRRLARDTDGPHGPTKHAGLKGSHVVDRVHLGQIFSPCAGTVMIQFATSCWRRHTGVVPFAADEFAGMQARNGYHVVVWSVAPETQRKEVCVGVVRWSAHKMVWERTREHDLCGRAASLHEKKKKHNRSLLPTIDPLTNKTSKCRIDITYQTS